MNGFSTLVICISGLKKDVSETINSLSFARKVMNLKNNPKLVPAPDSKVSFFFVDFEFRHCEILGSNFSIFESLR